MASPDMYPEDAASPDDLEYSNGDTGDFEGPDDPMAEQATAIEGEGRGKQPEGNEAQLEHMKLGHGASNTAKPNPKDPTRPRRKKARRACFACQRAHLTCGDERPCQRCIKRGLQDQCADGVRKKAKYLHDAPAEALLPPGVSGRYHPLNGSKASLSSVSSDPMTPGSLAQAQTYYASQPNSAGLYSSSSQHEMPPPMQPVPASNSFSSSQGPISPPFSQSGSQATQQMQNLPTSLPHTSASMQQFGGALFDPSDPALFNLDIASLNFGNHYGALEFGMLDQMSSGAYRGHGSDGMQMGNVQDAFNPQYTDGSAVHFGQDALMNADWQGQHPRQSSAPGLLHTPNNTPNIGSIDRDFNGMPQGFAIGAGPGSFASASPVSQAHDLPVLPDNPSSPAVFVNASQQSAPQASPTYNKSLLQQQSQQQPVQPPQTTSGSSPSKTTTTLNPGKKRPYDADVIYDTVTQPYSYTTGFHRLLNFINRRFSSDKRIRIAKALAAVRPSLITFSQQLTQRDLVFMEVSVQRKLCEYVQFINAYGTPTIITRRDGAVIAASKEFMILTGWNKNVLLGKEPNKNINTGGASGATTASGSGVQSAQRTRQPSVEPRDSIIVNNHSVPTNLTVSQPVLMAELLDQDSVVEFYEDYAKLAFGDSAGHAMRRGKLLKYRTKEDVLPQAGAENIDPSARGKADSDRHHKGDGRLESAVSSEAGINRLGEKEGMVDCMYMWNVRRDIFEVPMLIVMNFLPVI